MVYVLLILIYISKDTIKTAIIKHVNFFFTLLWFVYGYYSETLNNEYIERIHQMSYSLLSDNGMLQIFSFLIK